MQAEEYLGLVRQAGFESVDELSRASYGDIISGDDEVACCLSDETGASVSDVRQWASNVLSVKVRATKG
jgi:hypothetical protein